MSAVDLRECLGREVQHSEWRWLRPHHAAGRLVFARGLDLIEVGVAVAEDDSARVGAWLADGALVQSTDVDLTTWGDERRLVFLIVQPFVIALHPDSELPLGEA